jgi:addiction module RelE/StbE family toxin
MRIRWTRAAADDLEHIKDYLVEHYPHLAQSTVLELYETICCLKTSPRRGRLGRDEGIRELVLPRLPYIVAYRLKEQAIEILHIYHGAQNRP